MISPTIALMDVPAEVGRDLQGDFDLVRFERALHLLRGLARCVWDEVSGALECGDVGAALGRAIEVEIREADVLDVGGDAEAEGEHHEGGADEGEEQADRVAFDLLGLAAAIREHPAQAEPELPVDCALGRWCMKRPPRSVAVGPRLAVRVGRRPCSCDSAATCFCRAASASAM